MVFQMTCARGKVRYTLLLPPIKLSRNNTINMKKMIFAIVAAPAAIPVNPNNAATIAIIRNVTVQRNITGVL
jgi:hypothetical protein